jgi:hemerythrin-like domain-containing protein
MVKDHCKIENLMNNLETSIEEESSTISEAFNKFEWNLEQHIFVEEKAIFTSYNPDDIIEGYKMLPELTKQHNILLNKLNVMRKNIRTKRRISDVSGFKEFLKKHREYEEQYVYPNLNESLNEQEKRMIVDRIQELLWPDITMFIGGGQINRSNRSFFALQIGQTSGGLSLPHK